MSSQGTSKPAWPTTAAPTMLAAPDGSSVVQQQGLAAPGEKNMGTMWSRVQ